MGRIDELNKKKYVQRVVRIKKEKWNDIKWTMKLHNDLSFNGLVNKALDNYIKEGFHFDDYLGDLEQYKLEHFGFKESDLDLEEIEELGRLNSPYIIKEYKDRKNNIGLVRIIDSSNDQIMYDLYLPWEGKSLDDSNTIPNLTYNLNLNIESIYIHLTQNKSSK